MTTRTAAASGPATTSTDPVVRVGALTKQYKDVTAVDHVDLSLEAGSVIGLLGRNGAGKTTLMRMLTAQIAPTSGTIEVFGRNPYENASVQSRICFIREAQKYPDQYTVRDVLTCAEWFFAEWDRAFAARLVKDFDLPLKRGMKKLSRGQLSAVSVVLGLASRAPLTFFDEPYLGLDAVARRLFYDRLIEDYGEHPRTVLLSTHLIDEVADLLAHVVVIDHGRILIDSPADDLRGTSVTLVGTSRAVDELTDGLRVVRRSAVGHVAQATVAGPLDRFRAARAAELGVEIHPESLQQIVVDATLASGAEPEEVAS